MLQMSAQIQEAIFIHANNGIHFQFVGLLVKDYNLIQYAIHHAQFRR